eukprot:gene1226-15382_t
MFRRKATQRADAAAPASAIYGVVPVGPGFTTFMPKRTAPFLSATFDLVPIEFEFQGNCTLRELGIALVGGSSTQDRSANGIFIGNVEPGGRIARAAPSICKGFKIVGVNSFTITPDVAVHDMGRMISGAPVIKMTAQYDPWGFQSWDGGEELRQVSTLAFQGLGPQYTPKMVGNSMDLGMSNFIITANFQAKGGTVMGYQHPLFDIDNIHARGSTIVLIVREFDRNTGQRVAVCHMYTCKSKDQAAQFAMAAVNKIRDGQRRVQVAVQRGRQQAAHAKTAGAKEGGGGHGQRSLKLDAASMGGNRSNGSGAAAKAATKRRGKGSTSSTGSSSASSAEPSDVTLTLDARGGGQITARQIGSRCIVDGYPTSGTIRFVGLHKQNRKPRIGVELDDQVGKNNGIVQGTLYFSCPPGHGLLVAPSKVTLSSGGGRPASIGDEQFGGFEEVGAGSSPQSGGGSGGGSASSPRVTENFGWTMTLTKDYSGGTPLNSSNSRNSVSEFAGFGDERVSPEPEVDLIEEEFDEEADMQADANARRRQSAIIQTEGDMVQSRGKCGKCGMPVFADQSRSRDKKTGIYYHETCPTRRLGAMAKDKIREQFAVGERCLFSEFNAPGLIKYIGPFGKGGNGNTGQMWIGIELDDPTGVHNGTVDGVKYYTCKPGHGMIVLPTQLKPASRGASSGRGGGGGGEKVSNRDLAKTCLADIMADDTNDVVAVDLKVSSEAIVIIDKAAEEAVQEHATAEVMYCAVRFVHAFTAKGGVGVDASRQLQELIVSDGSEDAAASVAGVSASSRKLARKRSLLTEEDVAATAATATAEDDTGAAEILLACRARLLGTVPVAKSTSMNLQAVTHAVATLAKREFATPNVAIIVSEEGVRIIDEASQEQLNATLYGQINLVCEVGKSSHLKPLQGKVTKWRKAVFAMIHSTPGGRTECELFSIGPKAAQLVSAITAARQTLVSKQAKQAAQGGGQSGPFTAVSKKVTKVEGPLAGMQIKRSSLIATVPLGQGQFGEVMCAEQLVGAGNGDDGSDRCVRACKLLRPGSSTEDRVTFLAELELNQVLNHENLVQLVGVCIEARPWIAVLEFMPHGDIRKALLYAQDKGVQYTELEFLLMLQGAANILAKIRDDGYRLSQPEGTCSEDLYDLMTMCWDEDPKGRPKFKTIRRELDELIEELVDMSPPPRDIGQVAAEGVAGLGGGGGESDDEGDEFV